MAIPGERPDPVDVRGKVRIGEKAKTSKGKEYPKATDYFVSDDPEVPGKPKQLLVTFPYATADENFNTGLEWWRGKLLACYTKDGGDNPVALRVHGMRVGSGNDATELSYLDPDDKIVSDEKVGQGRIRIACRANDCPHFEQNADKKECRPMGRLVFFIAGGRTDKALQFETKAWGTIRGLRKVLTAAEKLGPLTGRTFALSVKFERKGQSTFPIVSIEEVEQVEVNTPKDVELADALIQLRQAYDTPDDQDETLRKGLAAVLDVTTPGWREREDVIARIQEIGVVKAVEGALARYEA